MKSVREFVIEDMVSALESITKFNGYKVDIHRVGRIPKAGFDVSDTPFIALQDLSEEKVDAPVGFSTATLTLQIICWFADFDDASITGNIFIADIEKAIKKDPQRNTYAIDTNVIGNETIMNEEISPYGGVIILSEVQYRHKVGDPYSKLP